MRPAEAIERICRELAEMSDYHLMCDASRDLTFRFATLKDCLPVRAALDGRLGWERDGNDSTATQAVFKVEGMTVTLFCPEMKLCHDNVVRGVGTLRHPRDVAVLVE